MKYWLHRITGGDYALNFAYPLLFNHNYLSIGWSYFSEESFITSVLGDGIDAINKRMQEKGWELHKNRWNLWRLIKGMQKGDIIVVPIWNEFSIFEIADNKIYSNESIDISIYVDWNGKQATKKENFFYDSEGNSVDLGFYRKVIPILIHIPRQKAKEDLYERMKYRGTNADISDLKEDIDCFLNSIGDFSEYSPKIFNNSKPKKNDKEIEAQIVLAGELLSFPNLRIPPYQRSYRWTEKNVRQLLEDVLTSMNAGKKNYRIGSVILHNNSTEKEKVLDIVDGQQRLTTLYLLWRICNEHKYSCPLHFGPESYNAIKQNYRFIQDWINEHIGNAIDEFIKYVLNSCDFVQIEVADLTEAFQMFDSQNGRGKELEPYNLLKAYHIRAMELESREEKIRCDKCWEDATMYDPTPKNMYYQKQNIDVLKQLFDEQLYRSRVWSRQEKAGEFSKKHIDEFKGFTIDKNHPAMFPFQNPQLLQYLTAKFYDTILSGTAATKNRFEFGDNDHINPFVNINQQILNGKDFFVYVETYVEIYKQMFINIGTYQLSGFKEFYYTHCLKYSWEGDSEEQEKEKRKNYGAFKPCWPASRTGDTYLREAYKSLIFVLFDKFGEKGLVKYYKTLYRLIYFMRIEKRQVRYNEVASLPIKYFKIIATAKDLADLSKLNKIAAELSSKVFEYEDKIGNQIIINFIKTGIWKI